MSVLLITRPPQYTDPWFAEIEQVWDELEAANMDLDTRLTTLENTVGNDVVLSISKSGDPQLTGDITLTENGSIVITQVGNNIEIGGGGYTDHGALTGLGDDDHTQYLLANGTRSLAGTWSLGNYELLNLRVENVATDPAAGNQGRLVFNTTDLMLRVDDGASFVNVGVTDHGMLSGLGDDDHLQYLLVDGTRDCMGDFTVQGKYKGPPGASLVIESQEDDIPTVVAHILDTATLLTDAGAKLLSIRNQGVEKFYVDKDGNIAIAQLSSIGSAFALIDTDNNSITEVFSVRTDSPSSGSATELFSVEESGNAWLAGNLKIGGLGTPAFGLDVTGTAGITGDVLLGGLLKSNSNLTMQVDANNDESASFFWQDGTAATLMSLNEAGLLTLNGNLLISGNIDISGTSRIQSTGNLTFRVDSDNDESASFSWENGTSTSVMSLDESGNLNVSGIITGGSSPFRFRSVEVDGASAVGYEFDTINSLSTDGSKILSIKNFGTEYLVLRRGNDIIGSTDLSLAEFKDKTGALALQLSLNTGGGTEIFAAPNKSLFLDTAIDYTGGATDTSVGIQMLPQVPGPLLALYNINYVAGTDTEILLDSQPSPAIRFYPGTYGTGFHLTANSSKTTLKSLAADGASAIAFELDTFSALSTSGANLFSIKNNGIDKFVIDKDGIITLGGGLTSATSLNAYIDNDANSSSEAFTVYHDVTTPTGGKELLQVRENGEVEIYGGPLIGGSSPFVLKTKESNGASAVGFQLQTNNALTTNGSKVLRLLNSTNEMFNIRNGVNARGDTQQHNLFEFCAPNGTVLEQLDVYQDSFGPTYEIQDFVSAPRHIFWHSNDFTQSPLGETVFIDSNIDATSATLEQWVQSLDGSGGYAGYAAVNMYGDASTGGLLQLQVDGTGASNDISFDFWSTNQSAVGLTDARAIFNLAGAKLAIGSDGTLSSAIGIFKSNVADGVGATAFDLRSINAISAGSTALLRVRNQSSIKFEVGPTGIGSFQNILYVNAGDLGNNSGVIIGNGTLSAQGVNANVAAAGFAHLYASQVGVLKNVFKLGVDGTAYISPQQLVASGTKVFRVFNNTGGTTLLSVDGNGDLEISGMLIGGSTPFRIRSKEADGASAIAFELNSNNTLSTAGAKLLSLKNNGTEVFAIDKDGKVTGAEDYVYVVSPSEGGAGIQAALTAVAAAGGGIVQLKTGTYTISSQIIWPATGSNIKLRGVGKSTILSSTITGNIFIIDMTASIASGLNGKILNSISANATTVTTTTAANATPYTAGMSVTILGTDSDGYNRRLLNEVKTTGDGGTGNIVLKHAVPIALTSPTIFGWAVGLDNEISNLKVIHTSGSSDFLFAVRQQRLLLENLECDGTGFSYKTALNISLGESPVVRNCLFKNYNVATGGDAVSLGPSVGLLFENNIVDTCVNESSSSNRSVILSGAGVTEQATVQNNQIVNGGGYGLALAGNVYFIDCDFLGNKVENHKAYGFTAGTQSMKNCTFSSNILSLNGIRGSLGDGLSITNNCKDLVISNNTISYNQSSGLTLLGATNCAVSGNTFIKNTGGNSVIQSCTQAVITGNTMVGVAGIDYAMYMQSNTNCSIVGNVFTGHKWALISNIGSNTDVVVGNNVFRGQSTNSLQLHSSDSNFLITGNNFRGETISLGTGANIVSANNME